MQVPYCTYMYGEYYLQRCFGVITFAGSESTAKIAGPEKKRYCLPGIVLIHIFKTYATYFGDMLIFFFLNSMLLSHKIQLDTSNTTIPKKPT
jgi:hypothetical protein